MQSVLPSVEAWTLRRLKQAVFLMFLAVVGIENRNASRSMRATGRANRALQEKSAKTRRQNCEHRFLWPSFGESVAVMLFDAAIVACNAAFVALKIFGAQHI